MSDKLKETMRILRSSKVTTDDRGRTVWVDPVETADLELVSTQMLKQIIDADDPEATGNLLEVASGEEGLIAHDAEKNRFEVISDEELQKILDGTDSEETKKTTTDVIYQPLVEAADDGEELELVSTQMLRRILHTEDDEEETKQELDIGGGFDPYNSS